MNIAWVIVVTIGFIYLQSSLYQRWGLTKITYHRKFNKLAVFEGQVVELIDQIANEKILPLPWVRLESKINRHLAIKQTEDHVSEDKQFHRTLFSFLPYQKITRRHEVTCLKRGVYALQTVSLATGDLFGFQEKFKQFNTDAVLTVYPKLLELEELSLPVHSFLGEQSVKRWIMDDPFMKIGTRTYQESDPIHSVNWKASARTNQLQVNMHDYTADHYVMIYLNVDQSDDIKLPIENEQLFEQSITYAASIAHYSISKGIETGFATNAVLDKDRFEQIKPFVHLYPESGDGQLYYLLDSMAHLTYERSRNFHYLIEEAVSNDTRKIDYVLITSRISNETQQQIELLRNKGQAVEIICMTSEDDD
ncbi:DUF58 domain-containing protein [Paraliobacillus zengyii]|uniref:DUF58 domain-containing protein n=1 Tax=Paraliobacillus zengyii TaxID=2213194 RepID=UPI000E3B5ADA|nr:DUF58 domain-containing protein [Paraliobacillus zengyii]